MRHPFGIEQHWGRCLEVGTVLTGTENLTLSYILAGKRDCVTHGLEL